MQTVHSHAEEKKLEVASLASTNGSNPKKLRCSVDSDDGASSCCRATSLVSSDRNGRHSASDHKIKKPSCHLRHKQTISTIEEALDEKEDDPYWYHADLVAAMALITVIEAALGMATESKRWEQAIRTHIIRLISEWLSTSKLNLDLRPVTMAMSEGAPIVDYLRNVPVPTPTSGPLNDVDHPYAALGSDSVALDNAENEEETTGITSDFSACFDGDERMDKPRGQEHRQVSSLSSSDLSAAFGLNSTDSSVSSTRAQCLEDAADRAAVRSISRCFEACVQINCKMQLPSRALNFAISSVHLWKEYLGAALRKNATSERADSYQSSHIDCVSPMADEDFIQRVLCNRKELYCRYLFFEDPFSIFESPLRATVDSGGSGAGSHPGSKTNSQVSTSLPLSASSAQARNSDDKTGERMKTTLTPTISTVHSENQRVLLLQQRSMTLQCCATAYDQFAEVTAKVESDAVVDVTNNQVTDSNANKDPCLNANLESLCIRLLIAYSSTVIAGTASLAKESSKAPMTPRLPMDLDALKQANPFLLIDVSFSLKVVARYLLQQHASRERRPGKPDGVVGRDNSPSNTPKRREQSHRYPEYYRRQRDYFQRLRLQREHWQKQTLGLHDKAQVVEALYTRALGMIGSAQDALVIATPNFSPLKSGRNRAYSGEIDTPHSTNLDEMQALKQCSKLAAGIFRDLTYYYFESSPPDYNKAEGHKRAEIRILKELARFYEAGDPRNDRATEVPYDTSPGRKSAIVNINNNVAHSLWGLSHIVRKQGIARAEEARHIRLEAIRHLEELVEQATNGNHTVEGQRAAGKESIKKCEQNAAIMSKYLHKWRKYHKRL